MWLEIASYIAGGLVPVIVITMLYRRSSREYRSAIQEGILIRQRRSMLTPWRWSFNRSEEDRLNNMKNELMLSREKSKLLSRRIPMEEAALKKKKDRLQENSGSLGQAIRDVWSARREPVVLLEDVKLARHKKKREPRAAPRPLLNITPVQ